MRVNCISNINNQQKSLLTYKNSEPAKKNAGLLGESNLSAEYYQNRIEQEDRKISILTRGIVGFGFLGAALIGCLFLMAFRSKPAKVISAKKHHEQKEEFNSFFKTLNNDKRIPTLENCKSLDSGLQNFLDQEVTYYNADPKILEETGTKPTNRILLNGAPGVGKSYFAKIFAKTIDANYLEVKVPDIISEWAGEGVKNMDNIFKYISKEAGSNTGKKYVVVFNEVDSYIQPVENYAISSKGTRWASKMEERAAFIDALDYLKANNPNVIIIGTTNLSPKTGIDGAAKSRFRKFEVDLPNENALYEAIKYDFSFYKYGDTFLSNNDKDIKNISSEMFKKKYSFRDLEEVINTSTSYYLKDKLKDNNSNYKFDYLKRAFDEYKLTDGDI